MTTLTKNLAANFLGKFWTALMTLAFLPLYIKFIGIEAYGIVGFYTTLLTLFSLLDLGLGTTINRELAQMSPESHPPEEFRNLTRTLELIYWPVAILICGIVFASAPFLANDWLNAKELSPNTILQAIYCMGIALATQWPFSLYSGGLMGLQKQVLLNKLTICCVTLRSVGMLLVLAFISPTLQAFFVWQMAINLLQTLLAAFFLWKNLPKSEIAARFDREILKRLKKFALGIAATAILTTILTQMDKFFLSKMLTLEMFGYYSLAWNVAGALHYLVGPIFLAFFPRFSQLIAQKEGEILKRVYHNGCQLIAVAILPIGIFTVFFSSELMLLWTRNTATAENTSILISLLMIGFIFNGLMSLPYSLQLAHGWTKLGAYQNLIGIIFLIPLLFLSIRTFGASGAAFSWILLNAGYLLISIPIMHRKIMKEEKWRWYMQDVGLPLLGTLLITTVGRRFLFDVSDSLVIRLSVLFAIFFMSILCCILITPIARAWARRVIFRIEPLTIK